MKNLKNSKLVTIYGGGPGRTCMIIGGVGTVAAIFGFFPLALGTIATGAVYGCFE